MTQIDLRLPERLMRRLRRRLAGAADPSEVLCALIEKGLAQEEAPDARGLPVSLAVTFDPEDMKGLERERAQVGLTRSEWVRACVRARLSRTRQLGRLDRGYLKRAVEDLKAIHAQVRKLRWAGERRAEGDLGDWATVQALARLEQSLLAVGDAIREGYLGNDDYWREAGLNVSGPSALPRLQVVDPAPDARRKHASG